MRLQISTAEQNSDMYEDVQPRDERDAAISGWSSLGSRVGKQQQGEKIPGFYLEQVVLLKMRLS